MMRIRHRTTSNPLYETRRETVSRTGLEAKGLDNPIVSAVYLLQKGYQRLKSGAGLYEGLVDENREVVSDLRISRQSIL